MGRKKDLAGALLFAALPALCLAAPKEPPPKDDTRIEFKKTLYVHQGAKSKVFAETRKVKDGDVLWKLLKDEYGVSEKALPTLIQAFKEVNPDADPNRLKRGQIVRVPFKVETGIDPEPPSPPPSRANEGYTVRPGDTLWKILHNQYGVSKEAMPEAIRAVGKANPGLRNPNQLWVGQVVVIPLKPSEAVAKAAREEAPPAQAVLPAHFVSVLGLLESMGCRVDRQGQTYIPIERGRTLRLEGKDFPLVVGPDGKKAVLDPNGRLSASQAQAMRAAWGYQVAQGADPEALLAGILPHLGFQEVAEGPRGISLGVGATLMAQTRWSVVVTHEDLWKGRIHLIFPQGARLDSRLAALAAQQGYLIHLLASVDANASTPPAAAQAVRLGGADETSGAAEFLDLLGVAHQESPEILCRLGEGVTYKVRPPLTFELGGHRYAVPPATPDRAEALLLKEGYFTFPWSKGASRLGRFADLLAFLGIEHRREEIAAPAGDALQLQVEGVSTPQLALLSALNARTGLTGKTAFLTEAALTPEAASVLLDAGYALLLLQ